LIGAAEGRDFVMHSRIGVLRALDRKIERALTDRKELHWGKRKLNPIRRLERCGPKATFENVQNQSLSNICAWTVKDEDGNPCALSQ
jgi:hypothetical protein